MFLIFITSSDLQNEFDSERRFRHWYVEFFHPSRINVGSKVEFLSRHWLELKNSNPSKRWFLCPVFYFLFNFYSKRLYVNRNKTRLNLESVYKNFTQSKLESDYKIRLPSQRWFRSNYFNSSHRCLELKNLSRASFGSNVEFSSRNWLESKNSNPGQRWFLCRVFYFLFNFYSERLYVKRNKTRLNLN